MQAILDERNLAREKLRTHRHYLTGGLFCARCGARLGFSRNRSKTGQLYNYFSCPGRRHTGCDLGFISAEAIEERIERF